MGNPGRCGPPARPAAAQESGGLGLSPEALSSGGPRGLARPLRITFPNYTAADLQSMPTAAERRQNHQNMIARIRGDGGYQDGFSFGQPRAASRQRPLPPPDPVYAPVFVDAPTFVDQRTKVVNRFEAPVAVTVGDNNVVQQQGANGGGSGAAAQQQVATVGARMGRGPNAAAGGGAMNLVTPEGNVVQRAPGAANRARN